MTPIVRDRLDGDGGYTIDNWAYAANGMAEYHGRAVKGSLDSESAWLIEKWTYDGSDRAVTRRTSETSVKWTDRGSITFS